MKIFNAVVVVLVLVTLTLVACQQERRSTTSNEKTSFEKVFDSGQLRVGYIAYPPGVIIDPNTQELSGIMHDVLNEIGLKLDLEIKYTEETTWATMIEALQSDKVDIICTGLWPNASRAIKADFTDPIYYSPVYVYGRKGFDLIKSAQNNIKISIIEGEMTSSIAKYDFPEAELVSLPNISSVSEMLLSVESNKSDITFVEPYIAESFIAKNERNLEILADEPIRVFPNAFMFKKGEVDLIRTVNIAIEELHNTGYISKVIAEYEEYPNSFLRVDKPYLE